MSGVEPRSIEASPAAGAALRLWWGFVGLAGGICTALAIWPAGLRVIGVNHFTAWFLDLGAILASIDAQALGLDPYAPNPLDFFRRPHGYSHWWLELGRLGLTRADLVWLGFALVGAFFVAMAMRFRPRAWSEVSWVLAIFCSPPVLLALDRANNDLVIFVLLAPVVPCLLSPRAGVRLLAVPLLAAAAALKAYPVVALPILLAGTTGRDTRRLLLVAALVLLALLPDTAKDFLHYAGIVPEMDGLMTMGSRNLFAGLGLPLGMARVAGPLGGMLVIAAFLRWNPFSDWKIAAPDRGVWLSFVLGALLLTGCFFAGASFSYRWIFALWLGPLLWQLPRDATAPRLVRRWAMATSVLLIFALWGDGLASSVLGNFAREMTPERAMRMADHFFYLEQPITWGFFICLLGFLTHFGREAVVALFTGEPAGELSPARSGQPSR